MISNLQILRAFAALSVAYFHTEFGWFRFGGFGVDVFFVISGFIMSHICATDPRNFLGRRLIRIVPLYWGLTLAIFLVATLAPRLIYRASSSLNDLALSLTFIPYRNRSGLVQPELFLGWTLNYEIFFYLNIATALALVPAKYATKLAAVFIIAAYAIMRTSGCSTVVCTFYGSDLLFEFLLGIAAYHLYVSIPQKIVRRTRFFWAALCGGSLTCVVLINSNFELQAEGIHRLLNIPALIRFDWLPDLAIPAFLLVLSAVMCERIGWAVRWRWGILLGNASYVVYLIHPYIIHGLGRIVAPAAPMLSTRMPLGLAVFFIVLAAASAFIHLRFERPIAIVLRSRLAGDARARPARPIVVVEAPSEARGLSAAIATPDTDICKI